MIIRNGFEHHVARMIQLFWLLQLACIDFARYSNVDLSQSTLVVSQTNNIIGVSAPVVVTLQLRDKAKQPIVDIPVRLEAPYCTIEQDALQTDANGQLTATLTSEQVGKTLLKAYLKIGTYATYLDKTVELEFSLAPSVISTFQVTTPAIAVAGVPFVTLIRAVDINNQLVTNYQGVIKVYSSDPANPNVEQYVMSSENQGVMTIPSIMYTASGHYLLVQDSNFKHIVKQSSPISVLPGQAIQLQVHVEPQWVAGEVQPMGFQVQDAYGNIVTSYQGSFVLLQNNEPNLTFQLTPQDEGRKNIDVAIEQAGDYTILAYSVQDASILSYPASIQVLANIPKKFAVEVPNHNITHGTTMAFPITIFDDYNNVAVASDVVLDVDLTASTYDNRFPVSSCPDTIHFLPQDQGRKTLECTFDQLGLHDVHLSSNQIVPMHTNPIALEVLRVISVQTSSHRSIEQSNCALLSNRKLKCWGANSAGQLGIGDVEPRGDHPNEMGSYLPYVDLGVDRQVVQYTLGANRSCAVLDNGDVKCWGAILNHSTYPDELSRGHNLLTMGDQLPSLDLGLPVVYMDTAGDQSCLILDNGGIKCIGQSDYLGYGLTYGRSVPAFAGLAELSMGTDRTALAVKLGAAGNSLARCARLDNGRLKCWGENWSSILAQGDTNDRTNMGDSLPYAMLGTSRTVLDHSMGLYHACAVLDNHQVKCWGAGYGGALGDGTDQTSFYGYSASTVGDNMPIVQLGTNRLAEQVVARKFSTCVVLDDGNVKCWGLNGYDWVDAGVTGIAGYEVVGYTSTQMGDALPTIKLGNGRTAVQMTTNGYSACAVLDNGLVKCWGGNDSGNLGLGDRLGRGRFAEQMGDQLPFVSLW